MIITIVGPTAVGKTKLSIALAKRYDAQIISGDSMQIYKKMDIATAKVTEQEKNGITHHMLDIKDVNDDYSVYDYQKDARKILNGLLSKNKNVIIVGGTGLYIKSLLYNYEFSKVGKKQDFSNYSNQELYNMVLKIDTNTNIHINNRQRLESYLNNHFDSKKIVSDKLLYDTVFIGLTRPRQELYDAINHRVDEMINNGLLQEAKYFYDNNINSKAIKTAIGYKELYLYFNGEISLDDATELIKKRSRNYAKRQYTWFNNQMSVKWFNIDIDNFNNTIDNVIRYIEKEDNNE